MKIQVSSQRPNETDLGYSRRIAETQMKIQSIQSIPFVESYKSGTIFGFTINEISNALGFEPRASCDGKSCAMWDFSVELDGETHDCSIWDWKGSSAEKYFSCFMPFQVQDEVEKLLKQN